MWADSHCHIDFDDVGEAAVDEARVAGVTRLVSVGTDADHSRAAIAVAQRHDGVWATVGLHPHEASRPVDPIVPLLGEAKVVAVGECGLDYHYEHSPRAAQRRAFAAQIGLANDRGLALVVHSREAWDDTFDVLDAEGMPDRTVFHCFTGGPEEARRCLDRGAYLSFSGIVSFKAADDVRAAAALCPPDRLLVETDAPFLAPVPHRGKPNRPAWVVEVGRAVAAARGAEAGEVEEYSWAATAALFGLPLSDHSP